MEYLHWKEETLTDFSGKNVSAKYNDGFVFTRIGKGVMHQTRSVRIDLSKFELSSENRRILKKTEGVSLSFLKLPLKEYDFKIAKLAKDFYTEKFGPGVMSAQKIKEMLTDESASNFNVLFRYDRGGVAIGYAICYSSISILHYSYPFYDLSGASKDMGLGMMIRGIETCKSLGHKYIYLGSLQRPSDTYKLQFAGLEWFDGKNWQTDTAALKEILK